MVVLLLLTFCMQSAIAQTNTKSDKTDTPNKNKTENVRTPEEEKRLLQFTDKEGGYKDKNEGYYNPKEGTYKDKKGGIVDNWQGYTYTDGSYKSQNGDYWDAKTKMVHLAAGDVFTSGTMTSSEVIKVLRKNVEDTDRYDKNYIRRAMLKEIELEHPLSPAKPNTAP